MELIIDEIIMMFGAASGAQAGSTSVVIHVLTQRKDILDRVRDDVSKLGVNATMSFKDILSKFTYDNLFEARVLGNTINTARTIAYVA